MRYEPEELNDAEKGMLITWMRDGIPLNICIAIIQAVRNRNAIPDDVAGAKK